MSNFQESMILLIGGRAFYCSSILLIIVECLAFRREHVVTAQHILNSRIPFVRSNSEPVVQRTGKVSPIERPFQGRRRSSRRGSAGRRPAVVPSQGSSRNESSQGPPHPTLRANPFSEVTDGSTLPTSLIIYIDCPIDRVRLLTFLET